MLWKGGGMSVDTLAITDGVDGCVELALWGLDIPARRHEAEAADAIAGPFRSNRLGHWRSKPT
jgi:hypothetical protein